MKYFMGSYLVTLFGLLGAYFWGEHAHPGTGLTCVFIASVLAILEISLSFDNAVVNAMKSTQKVAFSTASAITVGTTVNGSVADKNGSASYATEAAAVVLADGKVVAALVDCADATLTIEGGEGTALTYAGSKLEQGDNYNMVTYGGAQSEWYVQAKTYAATAVGKTASEVSSLATEGVAGCTIAVDAYKAAIVEAVQAAR